jgi:imidazolonepropionase-like amidohydrolase
MLRAPALCFLLLLAILLSACEPAHVPALAAAPVTAFVDFTVVPMDADHLLPHHTVLVRGSRIIAVGPSSSQPVPAGAFVLDGRGRYLMPGLADMHVHLNREIDLALYLARGVTTVRNMWGAPVHLAWRARIEKGELRGPTIYTAGPIVDGEDPVHEGSLVVRTPEDAERAVRMHKEAGYDFVKVYSKIGRPAYERLAAAAKAAGLPLVGHVPRAVGFVAAVDAGQASVEHMNMFGDALQADGSPVAGKFDDASWDRKIDFVDEAKIPALVQHIREHGASICPTRTVLSQFAGEAAIRERLKRPEMHYVPGFELAIWSPAPDGTPEAQARRQRSTALADKLIRALHEGGVRLLAGTDVGNPLQIPGFTLHEELEAFVRAGLTPYEALRTATRDAADFMGSDAGVVAVGRRADLVLLDADPLADVRNADHIVGVMARGRWIGPADLSELLAKAAAYAERRTDPFEGMPALTGEGKPEFSATYDVSWRGVPFDNERVLVTRLGSGELAIHAQTIDPHRGQWFAIHLAAGQGSGRHLIVESDGAQGRGRVELTREGARARVRGTMLSGVPGALDADLPEAALLGAEHMIAGKLLLVPKLGQLGVGQSIEVRESEVALGSTVEVPVRTRTVTRTEDTTITVAGKEVAVRRYELSLGKKKPDVMLVDGGGWLAGYEIQSFGVRFVRR